MCEANIRIRKYSQISVETNTYASFAHTWLLASMCETKKKNAKRIFTNVRMVIILGEYLCEFRVKEKNSQTRNSKGNANFYETIR